MRSTSPVSSQASTFLKQRSIRTRKSIGGDMLVSGQGVTDGGSGGNKSSLLDESEMTYKLQPQSPEKQKQFVSKSRTKQQTTSKDRELHRKKHRTDQMLQ